MRVVFAEGGEGLSVKLSSAEALTLLEELGDAPAKRAPKIRQLYTELTAMLHAAYEGEVRRSLDQRQEEKIARAQARAEKTEKAEKVEKMEDEQPALSRAHARWGIGS